MGRPPKRKVTATAQLGSLVSTRLSSIWFNVFRIQRETFPCPKDPDLLRLIVRALVFNIERVNKKMGAEARSVLVMLAMREALTDPDYHEGKYFEDFDKRSLNSLLYSDPTIKDLIKRLAEGNPSRNKHDTELLKFQRELVLEYIAKHPLPRYQKNSDEAVDRFQDWVTEHSPSLMPTLMVVACGCGYPPASKSMCRLTSPTNSTGDPTGNTKRTYRQGYSLDHITLALLAHLHGTSPRRMANLLKKKLSSDHPPLLTESF